MKRNVLFLCALLAAAACSKSELPWGSSVNLDDTSITHEMIVLGDKLEDPYTVANITKAVESLYGTRADRGTIAATDYYVRFLPKDEAQLDDLLDMGLELIDHPVDYQIVKEGDYYHDPSLADDEITWQYAVVRNDFSFPPSVRYEKLDDCYIAEHAATKASWMDWEAVEREAYRLTGNQEMLLPQTKDGEDDGASPQGRISIVDPALDSEPVGVKGVKVSCNSFVKFASAYTDEEGYYKISRSFSTEIRYRLVFKNRKGFGIGFNLLLQPASASTLGKNTPAGVSMCVTSESERKLFARCVVNNACWDYWESCVQGSSSISTPPSNLRIWLFQKTEFSLAPMLQQGVLVDNTELADVLEEYSMLLKMFLPDVILGLSGKDSYQAIYTYTQHYLAHASHFAAVGKDWWLDLMKYSLENLTETGNNIYGGGSSEDRGLCEIAEMWAYYVQTILYRERYGDDTAVFGTSWWFFPQIFVYLDERGLSRFQLFTALSSDITTRDGLQEKLLALYPEEKGTINQAFMRYN